MTSHSKKPEQEQPSLYPASVAIESEVLGAILEDGQILDYALEAGLGIEEFTTEFHRNVFSTVLDLYAAGAPFDLLTIAERVGEANIPLLAGLIDGAVVVQVRIVHHIGILRRKARLRAQLRLAAWIEKTIAAGQADPAEIDQYILDATTPRAMAAKAGNQ
jgi:replicative DNA helicase